MSISRILVIRTGRSGDIVMITAALRAMLNKFPDAQIDMLTSPDGKRVLKGFHSRVKLKYIHDRKSIFQFIHRRTIKKNILSEGYDKVYCFELNPSTAYFYNHLDTEVHQIKLKSMVENYAHLCLELVVGLTEKNSEHEWTGLPVSDQGKIDSQRLLATQGIDDNTQVIGFHPSFSGLKKNYFRSQVHRSEKAWPVESFGKLAIRLTEFAREQQIKIAIIMDLLPEDRALGEEIVAASQGNIKLFVPELNFERYKATLARVDILVVPNTGPMHIAGAVGTNLVALFGNIPPEDSGAYVPSNKREFIQQGHGANDTIATIPVETVYQACLKFLKN